MNNNDIAKLKFLPLGTVVLLKNAKKRVMITGFCVISEENKRVFDYTGCVYPEGVLTSKQSLVFDHDQIEKIFAIGYSDDEEKEFKKKLVDYFNKELIKTEQKMKEMNQTQEKEEVEEL